MFFFCLSFYFVPKIKTLPTKLYSQLQNYTEYVGRKSTFRLLNRGSAKALDKVVELDGIANWYNVSSTCYNSIMNY
jgi:hypothetical protein